MSPSASNFLIIGNPNSKRVAGFQQALHKLGLPAACVISYVDLLNYRVHLADYVSKGTIVRIESPDRDFEVERLILKRGADETASENYDNLAGAQVDALTFEKGRILYPRQWYLGYCRALDLIAHQLEDAAQHCLMNSVADIKLMFDKPGCHHFFNANGLSVPNALYGIGSFDELERRMKAKGWHRVFIKLAHGSSGAGVVAYQTNGQQHKAISTVEVVETGRETKLFNTRRLKTYDHYSEIRTLIDSLCRHRVHVEQWVPKAAIDNKLFDLRVVIINDKPCHTVARLSQTPMTNLHLLNERRSFEALESRLSPTVVDRLREDCRKATECFPNSHYFGLDIAITSDWRRHMILEANAFGDQLNYILHDGEDTYTTEIRTLS